MQFTKPAQQMRFALVKAEEIYSCILCVTLYTDHTVLSKTPDREMGTWATVKDEFAVSGEFPTAELIRFDRHPLLESVPILPRDSEAYRDIFRSIQIHGVLEPLKCVAKGERLHVVDGLHRLAVANELGISSLPYREVEPKDALVVLFSSLVRADWTKSALAYRMWPLFAACACKKGGDRKSKGNEFSLISANEIANRLGISEKLVDQAKKVHQFFSKNPDARAKQEPGILTGNLALHKAGSAFEEEPPSPRLPIQIIETHLKKLPDSFKGWEKAPAQQKERAKDKLATALHQLPRDIQESAFEVLEVALGK